MVELGVAAGESQSARVLEDGLAGYSEVLGEISNRFPGEVTHLKALEIVGTQTTLALPRRANFGVSGPTLAICNDKLSQVNRFRRGVGVTSAHLHVEV